MLTLGGSVTTTAIPPSFVALQDPGQVKVNHDLSALANYYNTTLTDIGRTSFANASFLLMTFRFVNIPPAVNATAQLANADLASVNSSAANAAIIFQQADLAIRAKEYVNATALVNQGCSLAQDANRSLADFQGPQTSRFKSESVPVSQYSTGSAAAQGEVQALLLECTSLRSRVNPGGPSPILLIGSQQAAIETGGPVRLVGNLTFQGAGVTRQEVLFYINGSYFGSLETNMSGGLSGTLRIPFVYFHTAAVQAFVASNSTLAMGGATSNVLIFQILFNDTAIVIGDPPAILPTFSFGVEGNLTTVSGVPLPDAPVKITFFNESQVLSTDAKGVFATRLTVPAYASDGIYNVYASFAPQGVFGPSFNFTSIEVVHLPMNLTVNTPTISLAGFSTTLKGTATSNGSAVAGATVTVSSPWGSASAQTDASGAFEVSLPVSPLEFAFGKNISVSAAAAQPYIADGLVGKSVGLFNILIVVLPMAAIGIIGYEADRLGVFEGIRSKSRKRQEETIEEVLVGPDEILEGATATGGPEILQAYRRALGLASSRFSIRFKPSRTIREIVAQVRAQALPDRTDAFEGIMFAVEDFLYAQGFDASRLEGVKARLAELERYWA